MLRSLCLLIAVVFALGAILSGVASAASDPDLVGWWGFDEGSGTTAVDSSGYGNDGTLMNGLTYVEGYFFTALEFDGADDYVEVPHDSSLTVDDEVTVMMWANLTQWQYGSAGYQGLISKSNSPRSYSLYTTSSGVLHFSTNGTGTTSSETVPLDEWVHVAAAVIGGTHQYYLNGADAGSSGSGITLPGDSDTASVLIGDTTEDSREVGGTLDDVRIYRRGLTLDEIQEIMLGKDVMMETASNPVPVDAATDVRPDSVLSWTSGRWAATHDVYLGTNFEDVDNASRSSANGLLVSQNQTTTAYDPEGLLDIGQTYYWRVDEVNAAPDDTIFKGAVWSFTTEPLAYPVASITVSTNATYADDAAPEKTIDGSGLNANGQHSTTATDMFQGEPTTDESVWLLYEFDRTYKLNEMLVWNYNQQFELLLGFGIQNMTVEYTADGVEWVSLGGVDVAQATAKADYAANTTVDFAGAAVQAVRLTVNANWGGMAKYGLSEVRFMYIPAHAREPQPADDATDVTTSTTLSWRPGRAAVAHEVYVSSDEQAVIGGTALVDSVSESSYAIDTLEFGSTYYWKVNEVQDSESWESNLWTFSTEEFALIDDFESYNDEDNAIYDTWIDGWTNGSGSTAGYLTEPFAETSIYYSSSQSLPLTYDNSASPYYSEVERDLGGLDVDTNGADRLVVHYRGNPVGFVEQTDGTLTIGAGGADIYSDSDEGRLVYKQLNGDGTIIARVDSIYNSQGWAKGGVMIRENLTDTAPYAMVVITPENGVAFQYRTTSGGDGSNAATAGLTAPHWVKLTRTGDIFTAQESADGVTWVDIDEAEIALATNLYVGLVLTSHSDTVMTSADFSNVSVTGTVNGEWKVQDLGVDQPSNDPDQVYLVVEDTSGKTAVVTHPDAEATLAPGWQTWEIPFTDLSGVNLNSVATLYIGVGDRNNPSAGGVGTVYVDDISYGRAAPTDEQ